MATNDGHSADRATSEGTARFAARHDATGRCFSSAAGLNWSKVGLGTYLGNHDDATDDLVSDAVARAVAGGINVIDTAANYRAGRAEAAVGRGLTQAIESGAASRDELIISTKAGYIPTPAEEFLNTYVGKDGITETDLVAGNHCLHPAYIEDRIEKSRAALGGGCIDVFYLHNPENQLGHIDRTQFDNRLWAAFEVLENAARSGKIGVYGLATWRAFRASPGEKGYISIAGVKTVAKGVAGSGPDHCKCLQMPLALSMPEAINRPTQWIGDATVPAVAASRLLGLAVCASASIGQGKIPAMNDTMRTWLGADLENDQQRALQFTRSASGVTSALVGMKTPDHVAANLHVQGLQPLPRAQLELMFRKAPV